MPQKLLGNDVELNEHFEPKELKDAEHADGLTIQVTCRHCKKKLEETNDREHKPKAWELELSVDGGIDRGSRNALLAHAKSHFTKPKLRRLA